MNSISMDAAFAEDSTVADDPPATGDNGSAAREQIGRFCPIARVTDGTAIVDDYSATPAEFRYAWAADLFDYLTVQAPSHDSLPNYDRTIYTSNAGRAPQPIKNGLFAPATDENPAPPGTAALGTEDTVPLHGLININTAPWYVLSAIPWVKGCSPGATDDRFAFNESTGVFSQAVNGIDDNIDIAKAIVLWRDGVPNSPATANGPFKTIFDIYKVTDRTSPARNIFRYIQDDITKGGTTDPDDAEGDFTPYNLSVPAPTPQTDDVKFDFEDQYLILTRISNLITTRSDSFTVYILVQGWTGVGTVAPELVVQRRAAFILDRSPATPESSAVNTINVPND
jgi:hypothetical protein